VRWAILAVGLILVLLRGQGDEQRQSSEASASLLLMTVGLMLIATANELILLFVGLELVSIPTYILLYLGRHDARGQEAASKYFFLSILSSAVLLYGFSFLYGAGGSTRLELIAAALKHPTDPGSMTEIMIPVAMLLMFAGLAFRLTAVPFHFYAPDVYQGTSHANAGLLSTLPKIAGLAALARILLTALPGWEPLGWKAVLVVSILTMTVGNILALWQNNIRRLLAYSSIAHAGYLLIGVAVALAFRTAAMPAPAATTTVVAAATVTDASGKDETSPAVTAPSADATAGVDGLGAAMFYLAVYIFATLGAFAAFVYLSHGERQIDTLDDIAGLNRTHPMVALTVALFMFSLAGVPPLAGFWGKFALLYSALKTPAVASSGMALRPWFIGLAIVAVLNAAIAAAYYLRVISAMYFRPVKAAGPSRVSRAAAPGFALVICTVAVVGVGFLPGRLLDDAVRAGQSLTPQTTLAVAEHADHRLTIKTTQQPVVAAQSR
jgi:NADH-quinone oxidoreductase subunit N